MPFPSFDALTGDTLEELLESLEKQRKELQWLLQSLDTMNVKELHADVINAGKIKSEFIQIGEDTEFENGYNPLDALEMATDAFNESIATGEVLDLWKYPGTTLIDGGNIFTNSITANAINVSNLSAISANLGTINAGTIYGVDIFGSKFETTGGGSTVIIDAGNIEVVGSGRTLDITSASLIWDRSIPAYAASIYSDGGVMRLGASQSMWLTSAVRIIGSLDLSFATVTGLNISSVPYAVNAAYAMSAASADMLSAYNDSSNLEFAINANRTKLYVRRNGVVVGSSNLQPDI